MCRQTLDSKRPIRERTIQLQTRLASNVNADLSARFQTIHHCSIDVARGLVLLFGIDTKCRWVASPRNVLAQGNE